MYHHLTSIFLIISIICRSDACGSRGKSSDSSPSSSNSGSSDQARGAGNLVESGASSDETSLGDLLGPVQAGPLETRFDKSGSPSLTCNLDEDACCWNNAGNDDWDWLVITDSDSIDMDKYSKNFNTENKPSGKFLATAGTGADTQSLLVSCPIACSANSIVVTLNHYQTSDIKLEVCMRTAGSDELRQCTDVTSQENPSLAELTEASNSEVVLHATGFSDAGSMVIVDDISVDYLPCEMSKGGGGLCTLQCDGSSLCGWSTGEDSLNQASEAWASHDEIYYKNRVTGVASPDSPYLATYLDASDDQVSKLTAELDSPLSQDTTFAFNYFEATDMIALTGWCDDSITVFTSELEAMPDAREWKQGTMTCPANTKMITFICENKNGNEGGCGLDDIIIVAEDPLC